MNYLLLKTLVFASLLVFQQALHSQIISKIETSSGRLTNENPIPIDIIFSKQVWNPKLADFVTTNSTVNNLSFEGSKFSSLDSVELFSGNNSDFKLSASGDSIYLITQDSILIYTMEGIVDKVNINLWPYNGLVRHFDLDDNGNFYVATKEYGRIDVFSPTGDSLYTFGSFEEGNSLISIDVAESKVFVGDGYKDIIEVFDLEGNFLSSIGSDANLNSIRSIEVSESKIYCLGSCENIEVFEIDGRYHSTLELSLPSTTEYFSVNKDHIYASNGETIIRMDLEGNILQQVALPLPLNSGSEINILNVHALKNIDDLYVQLFYNTGSSLHYYIYHFTDFYNYKAELIPIDQGLVEVFLPKEAVTDLNSEEFNLASNTLSIEFDSKSPKVVVSTDKARFEEFPILVNVEFNEPIQEIEFKLADIQIDNQRYSASNLKSLGNGTSFTFELRDPSLTIGDFTNFRIKESGITDLAGNGNLESNLGTVFYRKDPPQFTVALSSDLENISTQDLINLIVNFSDSTQNFTKEDVSVLGGEVVSFQGDTSHYEIEIETITEGLVEILIESNVATDRLGTGNNSSEVIRGFVDNSRPNVTITSFVSSTTNDIVQLRMIFDDPVFDFTVNPIFCFAFPSLCFDLNDINIEGGYITGLEGDSFGTYYINLKLIDEQISVSVPADVAYNITDLGNVHSDTLEIQYLNGKAVLSTSDIATTYNIEDNILKIQLTEAVERLGKVALIDMKGRVVFMNDLRGQENYFDLINISRGYYILIVQWNDKVSKIKLKYK